MAIPSGLDAQIGFIEESTFATYQAPTRFLEFDSEGIALSNERIEGAGLRPGQRVQRSDRWASNKKGVAGDITLPVMSKGFGLLFEHMLGANATANPTGSVYTHTATLGTLTGKSLGIQVGRPDVGGTVRVFSYLGCKVASWQLACDVDGILTLTLTIDGVDEDTSQSLASASYASSDEMLVFTGASLTVGGTATHVRSFSISGDNGLATDRYFLRGSSLKKEQLESGMRELTGSLEMDFEDLTAYTRFTAGTEAELVATFAGSNIDTGYDYGVVVTAQVRFDGDTPTVGGAEILAQSLPFKVLDNGSDEPIEVVYTTTDTTV